MISLLARLMVALHGQNRQLHADGTGDVGQMAKRQRQGLPALNHSDMQA